MVRSRHILHTRVRQIMVHYGALCFQNVVGAYQSAGNSQTTLTCNLRVMKWQQPHDKKWLSDMNAGFWVSTGAVFLQFFVHCQCVFVHKANGEWRLRNKWANEWILRPKGVTKNRYKCPTTSTTRPQLTIHNVELKLFDVRSITCTYIWYWVILESEPVSANVTTAKARKGKGTQRLWLVIGNNWMFTRRTFTGKNHPQTEYGV